MRCRECASARATMATCAAGPQIVVSGGPYITIMSARPDYVVVPTYDPVVVYERPRAGFFIGSAIGFRFGVVLGAPYRPWGWGYNRIAWDRRGGVHQ